MIYCTINDFPAYGNLSDHVTKGYKACPICENDTKAIHLEKCNKKVYMSTRVFLPLSHPYRRLRKAFDGKLEHRPAHIPLTGKQVYEQVKDINCVFGKPYKATTGQACYKKMSIFWNLPYWEHLDNVFDSLIGTLLNIPGKTKDGKNARDDMVKLGIRPELEAVKKGKRDYLPPACYTLSKKEKRVLCRSLHGVKVPHGYSSNIQRLVSMKDLKLIGLKSHDCHTLMQEILPIAIRVIDPGKLYSLQAQVVFTLCELEMYFSPSFFDIMVHLVVHLVREVKLCCPVYLRYMYPFERNMGDLKGYVRNRSRPEGSIIEGYLSDEVLGYCTEHLAELEMVGLPTPRHDEDRRKGKGTIGCRVITLSPEKLDQAYLYILQQCAEVHPYLEDHMETIRLENPGKGEKVIRDEHNHTFIKWFQKKVTDQLRHAPHDVTDVINMLAFGPNANVISYEGYDINGYCFYTERKDNTSTMQNSGVSLEASGLHFASAKDNRPQHAKMSYYGVIEDIFELDFSEFRVPVFHCKWMEISKGVKMDDLGYTSVNFGKLGHHDEPFIMASQATQVFYMSDPSEKSWSVVIQGKRHGIAVSDLVPDETEFNEVDEIPTFAMYQNTPVSVDDLTEHYLRDDHNEGEWDTPK
ncbi:uncharacterized protein [Spinacia oleracea]|uniref:DUF4218 domain-containing protein n=1 Tax=Spinacia oleracea TaxID=3562 RepID=A0ABM3RQF7_SPIOL|nr:uncharacterized protein LOC110785073 [Spinacia oleracea]